MTVFPLLAVGFIMKVVAVLFVICALSLILIILVQKGKGGGLSGAFGGGMASGILGSKTGDFLTWVTIVLVGVFLTLAVVMAKFYRPSDDFGEGIIFISVP
jgi:preprotein translocase subunit SecG